MAQTGLFEYTKCKVQLYFLSLGTQLNSELKYYMGQGSLTWEEAQTACRSNGDDLASILTQEDYTAFQSITETQQFEMWIGLYWKTSTRMWEWSNGDPFPYCVSEPQLGASNCCSLTHKGHWQTENLFRHDNGTTEKVYKLITEPKN
uniref:C-type lectin domain-containing protein n=1 Tax=Oncorhynchus kisutch TaxID=8019 RepID=A0A8C7MSI8_ONCKI